MKISYFLFPHSFRPHCFLLLTFRSRTGIRLRDLCDPFVPKVLPCRNSDSNDSRASESDTDGVEVGGLVDRGPAEVADGLLEEEGSGGHGGLVRVSSDSLAPAPAGAAYGMCPTRIAGYAGAQWLSLYSATFDEVELGSRSLSAGETSGRGG